MSDKVIFLAFRNEKIEPGVREFLSCKHCSNKTFTMVWQGDDAFPLCQCAACGNHIGYVGWTDPGKAEGSKA